MEDLLFYCAMALAAYCCVLLVIILVLDLIMWYDLEGESFLSLDWNEGMGKLQEKCMVQVCGLLFIVVLLAVPSFVNLLLVIPLVFLIQMVIFVVATLWFVLHMLVRVTLQKVWDILKPIRKALSTAWGWFASSVFVLFCIGIFSLNVFRKETPADKGYLNK